jgi:hypothetical protein
MPTSQVTKEPLTEEGRISDNPQFHPLEVLIKNEASVDKGSVVSGDICHLT